MPVLGLFLSPATGPKAVGHGVGSRLHGPASGARVVGGPGFLCRASLSTKPREQINMTAKAKAPIDNTRMNGEVSQPVTLTITKPNIQILPIKIRGTSLYVQNRFGQKAMNQMHETQAAGSQSRKGKKKEPKDFKGLYEGAKHVSTEGWCGIPAPAFRNAAISACRLVGFKMTIAKLSIFTLADGYDAVDGMPLVKITKGEPHYTEMAVRNDSGVCDIRPRPAWSPGWEATVRIQFDADQFSPTDVINLMHRIGIQVGVGEGRPDSKESAGIGWGTFEVIGSED